MRTFTLIAAAATTAAIAVAVPAEGKKVPDCVPKGSTLEKSDGDVRIVSTPVRDDGARTTRYSACLGKVGKRVTLADVSASGDTDGRVHVHILDQRLVGVEIVSSGADSEKRTARVVNVRTRKAVRDTTNCASITDVAFLKAGALAYACADRSSFVSDAKGRRALEPAGVAVTGIGQATSGLALYYSAAGVAKSRPVDGITGEVG